MDITLKLINKRKRPHFYQSISDFNFIVMLDTGAGVSVWRGTKLEFLTHFKGAKYLGGKISLGGFGGSGNNEELYDVYIVPEIHLKGIDNELVIHNFYVAVGKPNVTTAQFILSSNVFLNCDYEIKNSSKELIIHAEKRDYYMVISQYGSDGIFTTAEDNYEDMLNSLKGMS